MLTTDDLMALEKEQLQNAAGDIAPAELPKLAELLASTNDTIRYQAFLCLQYRSRVMDDVYPLWDTFAAKLQSENSYQRSIGLMLIAENVQWDSANRIDSILSVYLDHVQDEKPITARQCIQSLSTIARHKPYLNDAIASKLIGLDLTTIRDTMRKPILLDIVHVLLEIRNNHRTDAIDSYFFNVLSGDVLDSKTKKQIKAQL